MTRHPDIADRARRLLEAQGPLEPPAGLADRVARAAMATAPRPGLLERWLRVAVPTALVATAAAVALAVMATRTGPVRAAGDDDAIFELAPASVDDGALLAMEVE